MYETNFFKDISLSLEKNILIINVVESPLIQTVSIEGIKKQSFVKSNKSIITSKGKIHHLTKIKLNLTRILF